MATEPLPTREAAESAAAAWIAKRDTAEWDGAAFEAWLRESASHRAAYYRLNAAWLEAGRLRALSRSSPGAPAPAEEFTTESSNNIGSAPKPPYPSRRRRLAIAAGIAATLIAAITVWRVEQPAPGRFATVVGGLEAVPLPDGSRVTLNTDSELRVELRPAERDVNLERGEAFFEVAKDPRRPFVVNAGTKRVIAVGTQFSVYRQGDEVRVTVAEGTVRLEDRVAGAHAARTQPAASLSPDATGSAEAVLLPAGSVARARKDAVLVRNEGSAEIEQQLSWRSGLLTFRDTPLSEAVAEFNRYNERKIVIDDPAIESLELGGVFRATDIDPFIALLEQGFPVRAREEGSRIVLTHN